MMSLPLTLPGPGTWIGLLALGVLWGCGAARPAAPADERPGRMDKVSVAPNGRSFRTADGRPFVPLGVTYYRPHTGWAPQVWKQFDLEATRQDFAQMKALGVNCVRVFLSYGSFFTEPDALRPEGLAKFDQFLDLAEAAGIYVHPTGPDHWEGAPTWPGDRLADERDLAALETFWRLFAARYRGRNVVFAYDLRNEPSVPWDGAALRPKWNQWLAARYGAAEQAARAWHVPAESLHWGSQPAPAPKDTPGAPGSPGAPALLDYQHFREEIADQWTRRQAAAIKAADPQALVTVGFIQWSVPALLPGVQHYAAFRPARQARYLDFLEIHFYPLLEGMLDYTKPEMEQRNLAYLQSIVREVAAAGKPVVLAEFGWYGGGKLTINRGVHPAADEEQQARWCRRAVEVTDGLATGWLNWGLYDCPEARDVSQLTGLLTAAGQPKAWARDFAALAARRGGRPLPPAPPGAGPMLDWEQCMTSLDAGRQFREQYFRGFRGATAADPGR